MNRRSFFLSGAVVLGALPAAAQTPAPAPAGEPLELLWSRPLPNVIELALAADGSRVLAADLDGLVRCWDNHGDLRWEAPCPGVNRLLCSNGGRLSLAYALRRPLSRRVYLLNGEGNAVRALEMGAAVTAAALAQDGSTAAIVAGRELTFCSNARGVLRTRAVTLPGAPFQIQMGPADTVYVAYKSPARVDLVKSTGKVLWSHPPRAGEISSISSSGDGKFLAVAARAPDDVVRVTLLDWRNTAHWTDARPGRLPLARVCGRGNAVLLTYEHKIEHGTQRLFEQRLAYLAGPNQAAWTKGGGYTAPLLVCTAADGSWVVALDRQREAGPARFRLYGKDGGRLWLHDSPNPVLIAVGSMDGGHFAAYRTDGSLDLVRVTPR